MTTFTELCGVGNISNCKSYYEEHKNVISNDVLNDAFRQSCLYGHINVAKWLYSLGNINIHAQDDGAFRWSCLNGHINVAKWLYSLGNINIHAQNECAFRWSCDKGHIDVAQWLYSLGNINVHKENEHAFRYSCHNRYLNLAQWLYSLGNINIHAQNDDAFRYSCYKGHIDVAQWLTQICPDYHLDIENNKIKSYNVITLKDKIKDKTKDEIVQILNIKTSNEQISEQCVICLDDANLKLHYDHNHCMCFNCMIEWYINSENNQLKCHLCKTNISYQNMTLFI